MKTCVQFSIQILLHTVFEINQCVVSIAFTVFLISVTVVSIYITLIYTTPASIDFLIKKTD